MTSTIEKGNAFRDHVTRIMAAAGWEIEATEVRAEHIKADALSWSVLNNFGSQDRVLIETKDYAHTLNKDDCRAFITDYESW